MKVTNRDSIGLTIRFSFRELALLDSILFDVGISKQEKKPWQEHCSFSLALRRCVEADLEQSIAESRKAIQAEYGIPAAKLKSARKPYNDRPGYVCQRVCATGGYIVVYFRDGVWQVVHEPIGETRKAQTREKAIALMKKLSQGIRKKK